MEYNVGDKYTYVNDKDEKIEAEVKEKVYKEDGTLYINTIERVIE